MLGYCPHCSPTTDGKHHSKCPNNIDDNIRIYKMNGMTYIEPIFPEREENEKLKEKIERLKAALKHMVDEAEQMRDGDGCDHSVNVCWCDYFKYLEKAKELLEEDEKDEIHYTGMG